MQQAKRTIKGTESHSSCGKSKNKLMNKRVFMTLIIQELILCNFAKICNQAISYGFI
jgi:hypothetical protein